MKKIFYFLSVFAYFFLTVFAFAETRGTVDHFNVTFSKDSVLMGESVGLTITAVDINDKIVFDYTGMVLIFSESDVEAELPIVLEDNTYTFKASDLGKVTFENGVRFFISGVQNIYVYDFNDDMVFGIGWINDKELNIPEILNIPDINTFDECVYRINEEYIDLKNKFEINQKIDLSIAKKILMIAEEGFEYLSDDLINKRYLNSLKSVIETGIRYPENSSYFRSISYAIENYTTRTIIKNTDIKNTEEILDIPDINTFDECIYKITEEYINLRNKFEKDGRIDKTIAKKILMIAEKGFEYLSDDLINKNYLSYLKAAIEKGTKYPENSAYFQDITSSIENYATKTIIKNTKEISNVPNVNTFDWYGYRITEKYIDLRYEFEVNGKIDSVIAREILILAEEGFKYLSDDLINKNYLNSLKATIEQGINYPENQLYFEYISYATENYITNAITKTKTLTNSHAEIRKSLSISREALESIKNGKEYQTQIEVMVKNLSDDKLMTAYTNLSKINLNSTNLRKYKEFLAYFRDLSSYEVLLRSEK